MNRIIKVVRMPNGKFLEDYDYSQGMESHSDTEDVLKANDFNKQFNLEFALRLYPKATVEEYEVEIKKIV